MNPLANLIRTTRFYFIYKIGYYWRECSQDEWSTFKYTICPQAVARTWYELNETVKGSWLDIRKRFFTERGGQSLEHAPQGSGQDTKSVRIPGEFGQCPQGLALWGSGSWPWSSVWVSSNSRNSIIRGLSPAFTLKSMFPGTTQVRWWLFSIMRSFHLHVHNSGTPAKR